MLNNSFFIMVSEKINDLILWSKILELYEKKEKIAINVV